MGFTEQSLMTIATKGVRKSKTLLALHMAGNFSSSDILNRMRDWLSVVTLCSNTSDLNDKNSYKTQENGFIFSHKPHKICKAKFPKD